MASKELETFAQFEKYYDAGGQNEILIDTYRKRYW